MDAKRLMLGSVLKDRVLMGNLLLRLLLVGWAIAQKRFIFADSQFYIDQAAMICNGQWGGHSFRMPLYSGYLCALSFAGTAFALVLQTLLIWATGVFLTRRFGRAIGAIWLFDPVLLIYSGALMTDTLFSALMVMFAICVKKLLSEKSPSNGLAAASGVLMAGSILLRPIGIPLGIVTVAFLGWRVIAQRLSLSRMAVFLSLTIALLVPRLYWNVTQYGLWALSDQGGSISKMFAGVAKYHGQGLDFTQAEFKWRREKPDATTADDYRVLVEHWPSATWLVTKSVIRVMIGHVNVEWFYVLTGRQLIGPGWFKDPDVGNDDQRVSRAGQLPWALGVIGTALLMLAIYLWMVREIWRSYGIRGFKDPFLIWGVLAMGVLAVSPVIVGDARFRAPILGIALVLTGISRREARV